MTALACLLRRALSRWLSPALVPALALTLAAAGVQAQRLSVAPQAGLWEIENKITYNGIDLFAQMRSMQAEMLRQLPADQRAMAEQMMRQQMEAMSGKSRDCISAEDAREMIDARRLIERMNEPDEDGTLDCRYELVSVSGNTVRIRGRCQPEDGWQGPVEGTMTLHDARRWSSRFTGSGRLRGEAAAMPGIPNPRGPIEFVVASTGRWVAASCGEVKPQR